MYQNPALAQALVRDRVAELFQSAPAKAHSDRGNRRRRIIGAARRGTGWILVDLGLRLATPRGAATYPSA